MLERISRHNWSIQAQFLFYSLALMVPALVFSGLMIIRSAALERVGLDREIKERLHSLAAGIDRELANTTTTLKALSSSPSLADGDLKAFYGQAMAAQEVGGDHFFLTEPSASSFSTRALPGATRCRRFPATIGGSRRRPQLRASPTSTSVKLRRPRCSPSAYP